MRGLLAFLLLAATNAEAQVPSASAAALGLSENFTALARGYSAVAWNPAALALRGNPRASLAVLPLRTIAGLDPITLGDIAGYDGEFIPAAVREAWLQSISAEGSEQGTGGGDLTLIAAQYGRLAVQLGSSVRAVTNVSPAAAELLLFGNYGRAGTPRPLDLTGSRMTAFAASTLALAYGIPLGVQTATHEVSIGATVKYTLGHVLLHGEDRGTAFAEDGSATIAFPVVASRTDGFDLDGGRGIGIDVGVALVRESWSFGLAVQNVVNTFAWSEDDLVFRAGLGTFDLETQSTDFEERPVTSAPAALRDFIDHAGFPPMVLVGAAYELRPNLTLTADFRQRLGDASVELAPGTHAGIGAEFVPHPLIPLRAGIAILSGGYQLAAGAGLNFGPINLSASLARRDTDLGVDTIAMLTLISTLSR